MNAPILKTNVVKAILTQPITYNKDGVEILIPEQTEILVDLEQNIALIGGDHIDVSNDEFKLI